MQKQRKEGFVLAWRIKVSQKGSISIEFRQMIEKGRDKGYSRLREQDEQNQRYVNVCLPNGHHLGNWKSHIKRGKSILGTKKRG